VLERSVCRPRCFCARFGRKATSVASHSSKSIFASYSQRRRRSLPCVSKRNRGDNCRSTFRRGPSPLRAFTAELGYSRYAFVEYTNNERAETLIDCLEHALQFFGGVPAHILCDNPKTIVIERNAYGDGAHKYNSALLDFAKHYGVKIKLCAPYRAQTKGKVERFIRYLRESFWVPLSSRLAQEGLIVDRETANLAVKRWLREVANARIHGTTGAIPAERRVGERLQLQPVPTPYGGRSVRAIQATPSPAPVVGLQHPLSFYDTFAGGAR